MNGRSGNVNALRDLFQMLTYPLNGSHRSHGADGPARLHSSVSTSNSRYRSSGGATQGFYLSIRGGFMVFLNVFLRREQRWVFL